jgi:hypothetical protein
VTGKLSLGNNRTVTLFLFCTKDLSLYYPQPNLTAERACSQTILVVIRFLDLFARLPIFWSGLDDIKPGEDGKEYASLSFKTEKR